MAELRAEAEVFSEAVTRASNICIVGGGPVGVELAGGRSHGLQ